MRVHAGAKGGWNRRACSSRPCPMEPWGLEPYDDHVMSTAESQLASAYMQMMRVPASIWSCGGDTVIIPDSVVPGLDGISWGKTCKGGRGYQ